MAGQIPTGWDPAILGVPDDIINQVDPVTLYTLVSTVEALVGSGVTDPYEFYEYVHVTEVGNAIGGGFGGMRSIRDTHRNRLLDKPVKGDALQEQFINTIPAWINMLLLSSSGPVRTPVGACATAFESIELGYDAILSKFHNPFEVTELFKKHNFEDIQLLWYHYHPAMPYLEQRMPEAFRREAIRLEHEPSNWRGYFLCSAFVVEAVYV